MGWEREAPYRDRTHAGEVLGELVAERGLESPVVLAVPNGGVAVGAAVARRLGAPLRLMLVRKLQIPWNTEAGFGAVTWDGTVLLNRPLMSAAGIPESAVARQKARALASIRRRVAAFGAWADMPELAGASAVLVDDGLASGFTMAAAVRSVRARGACTVVVAAPTASEHAARRLGKLADALVCPHVPGGPVFAVANAYENWWDVSDAEVLAVLEGQGGRC
jgi:predicted phosphoribosyltransferase